MSRLVWDNVGERFFETGIRDCVLYLMDSKGDYPEGVAWNGVTGVTESPTGGEATALYADDIKYLNLYSTEELGATITAYTYPDEFGACDGSLELVAGEGAYVGQQPRKAFGLCYRTEIGNDIDGNEHSYKIHLLYGCRATPTEKAYSTINDSPEAIEFSWELTTTPVKIDKFKPTSSIIIDASKMTPAKLKAVEDALYGTDPDPSVPGSVGTTPYLPSPTSLISML